jgi:hypothetical protein
MLEDGPGRWMQLGLIPPKKHAPHKSVTGTTLITIATTPRTCLMAPHTAFIRLSRRRIDMVRLSTHSKASTIQSCLPPLPRVGTILPRVLISKPSSIKPLIGNAHKLM